MLSLKGRTCVFAGGTGRIAQKAVEYLLKGGMNVVLLTHFEEKARQMMEQYADYPGQCFVIAGRPSSEELFSRVYEKFGSVDVFISKTGVMTEPVRIENLDTNLLSETFDRQVRAVADSIKGALPYLKKSRAGRIILFSNVGSINGFEKESLIDNVTRGAVNSLVLSLARQLAENKICVNCVSFSGLLKDHEDNGLDSASYLEDIPLKRIGTSEEFGALIEYLASEESGFVTGEIIKLSGGLGMGV